MYILLPKECKTSLKMIMPDKRENRMPNLRFAPAFAIFNLSRRINIGNKKSPKQKPT